MPTTSREAVATYLLGRASAPRQQHELSSDAVERLDAQAAALVLLAEFVRSLPEDDHRLLMLATLAVRNGEFVPGPGAAHAVSQFAGTSPEACSAFLDNLVRTARDDALMRARAHGHLPPDRPR